MVLDTSAIIAIEFREPGYEELVSKIEGAPTLLIGTPTVLETAMVLSRRLNREPLAHILDFLRRSRIEIVSFTDEHMQVAVGAYYRFGRGRHRAKLNLGDCMTYATASIANMPLLFTGNDFSQTDIEAA